MATAQDVFRIVRDEFDKGRLVLPTLPEVASRIGAIVSSRIADAGNVADEVAKDPAIASRLLSVANRAAIRGVGPPVGTLRLAIARLGFNLTRVLVSQMAMKQLFSARSPVLRRIMQDTWTRSLEVAALSQVLAAGVRLLPETAMLAGLIHRVGALPIVKLLDQHPRLIQDEAMVRHAIARLHAPVANLVLKAWKFPPELTDVPRFAFDYARRHDGPADYADVVSVATLLTGEQAEIDRRTAPEGADLRTAPAPVERRGEPNGFDRHSVPAFAKVGVSPEVETVEMSGLQDKYDRNLRMLGG